MTVTITQVRRAIEEASFAVEGKGIETRYVIRPTVRFALTTILADPTALTLMANSINQKLGADLIVAPVESQIDDRPDLPKCSCWKGSCGRCAGRCSCTTCSHNGR